MQKMTAITNLLLLNILWIVCSIPIITIGSATTAMYSVLFAYRRKETDSVFRPFFTAFRKNFVRSTLSWVVMLLLVAALGYDVILLIYGSTLSPLLSIPVIIVGLLVVIAGIYLFPQIALFDNKLLPMLKNCFLLFMLNPIHSLALMILALFPVILFLFLPQIFWITLLFWTLIGVAACASLSSFFLLKIFTKYIPEKE